MDSSVTITVDNPRFLLFKKSYKVIIEIDGEKAIVAKMGDVIKLNLSAGDHVFRVILDVNIIKRTSKELFITLSENENKNLRARYSRTWGKLEMQQ